MRSGDIDWLKGLLKQYDEDGSALWLYTQALIAYRENGISNGRAEELARKAWKANNHVPAVLAGIKNAKPSTNGYVMMGGEDEAAHYVVEWGFDWQTTPAAIDRLMKVVDDMASSRTAERFLH